MNENLQRLGLDSVISFVSILLDARHARAETFTADILRYFL